MKNAFLVGIGGFVGAVARYWVAGWAYQLLGAAFPVGTLTVNIIGSFFIGVANGFAEWFQWFTPETRAFLFIGFFGSFTTFSTFTYEMFALVRDGQWLSAVAYVMLHLVLGFLAVFLGFELVKLWR